MSSTDVTRISGAEFGMKAIEQSAQPLEGGGAVRRVEAAELPLCVLRLAQHEDLSFRGRAN